jgi:hypothetical protein
VLVNGFQGRLTATPAGLTRNFHIALESPAVGPATPFPRLACLTLPEDMTRDDCAALADGLQDHANAMDRRALHLGDANE